MEAKEKNKVEWTLLAAYVSGNISDEGRQSVENWLKESEENRETLQKAAKVWDASQNAAFADIDVNSAWSNVNSKAKISSKPRIFQLQTNYKIALRIAAVLVIGLVSWLLINNIKPEKTVLADNSILPVSLSDGSEITLNKEAELHYPAKFTSKTREVELAKGKAFFNIAKNPNKPFIIKALKTRIEVLGTSFNVSTNSNGDVEVIVRTGIVSFESHGNNQKVVLYKNEKAIFNSKKGIIEKGINSDPNYLSWKTRKFVFNKTTLEEVYMLLQDIYGVKIQVKEPVINTCHHKGTYENMDIDEILKIIDKSMQIKTTKIGDTYFVEGDACKEVK